MNIKGFKKLPRIYHKFYFPSDESNQFIKENSSLFKEKQIRLEAEKLAYFYLVKKRNYFFINLTHKRKENIAFINRRLKLMKFKPMIGIKGCPDFFLFRYGPKNMERSMEYFFCEIKGENDGWRPSQIRWLRNNPFINYCILTILSKSFQLNFMDMGFYPQSYI